MVSNTCKYGIRAVVFIASQPGKADKTGLKLISDELKIPQPYLAKILQVLTKKKILGSSKGPHGGFWLLKNASAITLMDIIKTIDGDDYTDSCFITGGKCSFDEQERKKCLLHDELKKEKQRLTKFFSNRTIESLVKQGKRAPELNI